MLKPYQMSSVIITGPKNLQEIIIKELHTLKVLHIVEHSKNELVDIGQPLQSASKLSEIIVKVRALIAALNIKYEGIRFELKKNLLDIEVATNKLNDELNSNLESLKKIEDTLSKNESLRQELEILKNINIPLEHIAPYKSLAYFTGYVKDKDTTSAVKVGLSLTTKKFMLLESIANKKCFIILFIEIKNQDFAQQVLQKNRFLPVTFSSISGLRGNASDNFKRIEEEKLKFQMKKEELKRKIEKLGKEYKEFLLAAEEFLSEQLEKAEAPLKFAATKSSFLIKGWVPIEQLQNSIDRLNKVSKNKVFVHFEPAKKYENVPIKLRNPKYAKPFEFFMELYTMPTYKEIDPTFFVFLTFPFLFGFMLGDIGYGLVTLILFVVLRKFMPKARAFFNILAYASLATIFFGLFFGEFFGFEEIGNFNLPHILSRAHDINQLMYLAVAVGAFHINLGLIIGFFNELKSHGFVTALYAKGSWFVFQAGVVVVALSALKVIALPIYAGVILILLSAFMLFKGEGMRGLIEIPSIFSNTLSYARLMAIGLSSVVLALIINKSAEEFFHEGGFLVLAGVLILLIGHVINIMLGLLTSFLHSLRLHYVEFFTKFFHGGAKRYQPFGLKEQEGG